MGATFESHPGVQIATITVADAAHPSTSFLPRRWERLDEWYNYIANPRGEVHVLATVNEDSYSDGAMGYDHPIAWCHEYDGGRAWYTGMGHTGVSYIEPFFMAHLLGGIQYAAGMKEGDCGATKDSSFSKVVLDTGTTQPMELDVASDGRVFFVEKTGFVKVYSPQSGSTVVAAQLAVSTEYEDGLLGIALDPMFEFNRWLYLFYSPEGAITKQHISRFTVVGDTLDMESEQVLLEIPTQRDECCHSGGSLQFDQQGNLYISTGDNTSPFTSDGYASIDERPDNSAFDSQRSASNTNDLRGKVLRITPQANGTYSIPDGNLFPSDGSAGRPEIYLMGLRNPFRISIDSETGWLYVGDVGPDATDADPNRGPIGLDEVNQAREAGNYGWPYCAGNNEPYVDYDFETETSGLPFDCDAPVNDSPNNTGVLSLPPAEPAMIWYPYGVSAEFPEFGEGGRTVMAGPVYHFDPELASIGALPEYYDDTLFIYEWSRNWIAEIKLDEQGDILKINPFLPSFDFRSPIDMEIGPDGAIYILEYGTGWGDNPDAQLVRIDYVSQSRSPVAVASAAPTSGSVPLTVAFSSDGSTDPDGGDSIAFAWDFTLDGIIDSTEANPVFTYVSPGNYTAQLTVTDLDGNQSTANVPISAGNTMPVVTIELPVEGGFFDWSDLIPFKVRVSDAEDGSTQGGGIDCQQVIVQPKLGHNDHAHPLNEFRGCEGVLTAPDDPLETANMSYIIEVRYTDMGAPGVDPLTGSAEFVLHPKLKQAEHFSSQNGVKVRPTPNGEGGGFLIAGIDDEDYISFEPMNLRNIDSVTYRVASGEPGGLFPGGIIEVYVDSPPANPGVKPISTAVVEPTDELGEFIELTVDIDDPGGTRELFFVFSAGNPDDTDLFFINWIRFNGLGVSGLCGDQNGDSVVTGRDVFINLLIAVGRITPTQTQLTLGDLDRNGNVGIIDTIMLLQHIIGQRPVLDGCGPL
ncbi:MAG: PQQ-dependent sugar dehydrogenase [Chloroflexi bacterium]|nr:PQQ-dependent sugar dehydrogenase [Chloroflexota bacterium]